MSGTSYDLAEIGTYTGEDVRLYRFQIGTGIWYYNNGDRDIEWNGVTWSQLEISDDGMKQKGEAVTDDFTITADASIAIVQMFRGTPPSQPIQVTLFQLQFGDVVAPIMWVGYISSVRYKDEASADIICNTQTAFLNRKGLRLSWTRACPHALYDQDCGVVAANYAETAIVTDLFGNGFGYTPDGPPDPGKLGGGRFQNGYIEWSPDGTYTQRRAIQVDNQTSAIIIGLTDGMTVGMVITMYPGCARTPPACIAFNNLPNYGGFPMMPGRSPFDGFSVF